MGNVKKTYATAIALFLFLSFSYSPGWSQEHIVSLDGDGTHIIKTEQSASSVPLDKISNEFSTFLGDNSDTVVYGLKRGDEIIFEETIIHDDGTTSTITTPIDPPTGSMGNGNVKISLGLAREELSQWGIDQPTGEELNAALVGGEITAPSGGTVQLDGVLTMRSEGMGWGQIAHAYGVKLGHVMRGMKAGKDYSAIPETTQGASSTANNSPEKTKTHYASKAKSDKAYGKGITSGANETHQNRHTIKAKATKQHKHTYKHSGIVTSSGAAVGGNSHTATVSNAGNTGHGHAYGHGIVNAPGNAITTATNVGNTTHTAKAGNSNGKGLAKGHYQ